MSRPRKHRSILIIEHDRDLRAAMCEWLRAIGFEAVGEYNGHSGLSHLALRERTTKPIDGVLMNLNLRAYGSREVLRELQKTHPLLPVVVMAESRRSEAISEALELGASGYLLPPYDPDAFKSKCLAFFRDPDQPDSYSAEKEPYVPLLSEGKFPRRLRSCSADSSRR